MRYVVYAALIGFATGCASAPPGTEQPDNSGRGKLISGALGDLKLVHDDNSQSMEFDTPRDTLLFTLLKVNEELGLPLVALDSRAGVATWYLQTYSHRLAGKPPSRYIDCGRGVMGDNADSQRISAQIKAAVAGRVEGRSVLTIGLVASSKDVSTSTDESACATNGTLERRIAELVKQRLQH